VVPAGFVNQEKAVRKIRQKPILCMLSEETDFLNAENMAIYAIRHIVPTTGRAVMQRKKITKNGK
jgi:hypothetical protein